MKILHTIFAERPEVGGMQLHPLSGARLAVLEERDNPLAKGTAGKEVSSWVVYEVLMAAVMAPDDLVAMSMEDDAGWKLGVRKFAMDVPDADLEKFWTVLEAEMDAIRGARVVPKKKAVRKAKGKTRR